MYVNRNFELEKPEVCCVFVLVDNTDSFSIISINHNNVNIY